MSSVIVPKATQVAAAGAFATATLNTGKLHLATAVANPVSKDSVVADFTEATYTGYTAPAVATWSAGFVDSNGDGAAAMPDQVFPGPTSGPGATIVAVYYTNTAGTTLLWAAMLDTPFPLATPLDALVVSAQVAQAGGGTVATGGSNEP